MENSIATSDIKTRRTTLELPVVLLEAAQKETGEGITKTVAAGLEKLALSGHYRAMRTLRGQESVELDISESREDRYFG